MSKELLQQVLEALEEIALAGMSGTGQESQEAMTAWHARQARKFIGIAARALDPLRAAMAAQQQEPVAWLDPLTGQAYSLNEPHAAPEELIPLYTTPPAQPAREWVGLTPDDINLAAGRVTLARKEDGTDPSFLSAFAHELCVMLREKNAAQAGEK